MSDPTSRRAATVLLAFGLPFGVFLALFTPPFQVPDEPQHFHRAYAISEGRLTARPIDGAGGDDLPVSIAGLYYEVNAGVAFHGDRRVDPEIIRGALGRDLRPDVRTPVQFPGSAVYFPLVYAPQATGIATARVLGSGPLELVYAGRLANVLATLLLLYLSVRLLPAHGATVAAFALLPTTSVLRSSLSADAPTLALSAVFVALIFKTAAAAPSAVRRRDWVLIAIAGLAVALTKQTYGLLVLVVFAIPASHFGGRGRRVLAIGALATAMLAVSVGWSLSVADLYRLQGTETGGVGARFEYVKDHPWDVLQVVLRHLWRTRVTHLHSAVGWFGWVDAPIPRWTMWLLFSGMLVLAAIEPGNPMRWPQRGLLIGTFVAGAMAITTLLYLSWTPIGEKTVHGVQGRYFLPFAILPLLAVSVPRLTALRVAPAVRVTVFAGVVVGSAVTTVTTLYLRYYS